MAINQLIAQGIAPIGRDLPQIGQMLQQKKQQEQQNALAQMAAQTDQVNATQFQRQNDLQAERQQMQIDATKREEYRQTGLSLLGWLDQNQGKPEHATILQQLAADPESQQAASALGVDLTQLGDPAYRAVANAKLRAPIPEQVAPIGVRREGGYTFLSQGDKIVPGSVQAPQRATPAGARQAPANVEEFQYFQSLTPAQREEYLRVKRGDVKPSSVLEKRLFDIQDAAFKSRANVAKYEDIATQLERVLPAGGVRGQWTEKLKEVTGSQDAVTELRTRWNEIRVSAAINNLPPGVASDKDIELAMSAFLPPNANAATVASFLRGLAKVEGLKADYHEFESDYLSNNKSAAGLNKAWKAHAAETYAGQGAAAPAGGVVKVASPQEAMALPSGTKFQTPDGRIKVRP